MAGNKKPKKRYNPARAAAAHEERLTRSVRASIMAAPIDARSADSISMICHTSIEAIRTGAGTLQDLMNLETLATATAVMCARGIGLPDLPIAETARTAVEQMVARYRTHNKVAFAGRELGDLTHVAELHDAQLLQPGVTNAMVIECIDAGQELLRQQAQRHLDQNPA